MVRRSTVARTRAGETWTEARFWTFIRSNLRMMSRKWPPIVSHVWKEARRPYKGRNRRRKWEYRCAMCKRWFPREACQVDHIVACGRLKSWDDVPEFLSRLLCEVDGLRVLCRDNCHHQRTQLDNHFRKKKYRKKS